MKKICIVSSAGTSVNVFMLKHIEYLKKNYDLTLIIGDESKINSNSRIIRINIERQINIFKDIKSLFQLYLFLKKEKFDIVLSIMPKSGLLAMIASSAAGVTTRLHFFTGQVWATKQGFFRKLLKYMDKIIVKTSSSVLIDSKSQKQFLIDECVMSEKDGFVLKKGSISGVNIKKFKSDVQKRKTLRKMHGINNDEIVFMFLGRINKDKGILDLNKVFLNLLEKYANIKLILIGPLEDLLLKEELKVLLQHKNVISKLEFVNNPEEILNMADMLTLPSYREGFGTIVIEAAAMGIPTIGSDIYGLNDAIINNKTGILHKVKDIQDMEKKYSELIENHFKIVELGNNAKQMAYKDFVDVDLSEALGEFIIEKESFSSLAK